MHIYITVQSVSYVKVHFVSHVTSYECVCGRNLLLFVVISHCLVHCLYILHSNLPLFVCVFRYVCACVCLHVLYALSACSQLIKTQCQLSCFLPACLHGVYSSRHQPPLLCSPLLLSLTSPRLTSSLPHLPHYPVTQCPSLASSLPLTPCCSPTLFPHLPPLCSLLLMSKFQNITLSENPRLSHATLGDEHSGWENNLSLKIG